MTTTPVSRYAVETAGLTKRFGERLAVDDVDLRIPRGEAADGREAVELARRLEPDVILMDVRMPELDGVEATRRIVESGARADPRPDDVRPRRVCLRGRSGGCERLPAVKDVRRTSSRTRSVSSRQGTPCSSRRRPAAARGALRAAYGRGGGAQARTADGARARDPAAPRGGLSNAELAGRFYLGETTVKTHVSAILRKLGVRDRVQAVIAAYDAGLVSPAGGPSSEGRARPHLRT
jgi:response regulator receiver domain-containing protein/regulatory LuxR family protein